MSAFDSIDDLSKSIDEVVGDLTQTLEDVVARERRGVYELPLKVRDRRELFCKWCDLNPSALDQIELTALAIDARGMRVSAKYLIERQRYEGDVALVGVPFFDGNGVRHLYAINNTDTPLLARWLLERHPDMDIETRKSVYAKEAGHDGE